MTPEQWHQRIWGDLPGWVSIFAINRDTGTNAVRWTRTDDHDTFAQHVAELAPTSCVWAGVATRHDQTGNQRGGIDDCAAVPALWLDVDIAGPGHADHPLPLPPDRDAAMRIIGELGPAPTLIVDTGGGLQPWWILTEPATVAEVTPVLERWGHTWESLARERHGWWLDRVWNVDRVLRVPGTQNRKVEGNARPVTTVADDGHTYDLTELDDLLYDPPAPEPPRAPRAPTGDEGERPGDHFNDRHDGHDVLLRLGFHSPRYKSNGDTDYVRAGKERRQGYSATVHADDGHITVWSDTCRASWPSLETMRPYDPFGLVVATCYRGDFAEATRDLRAEGYGGDSTPDLSWIPSAPELIGDAPAPTGGHSAPVAEVTIPPRPVLPLPGIEGTTPPFPLEALPEWVSGPCEQVADGLQAPVDLAVAIALGCLASLTQGKLKVNVSHWSEWTNLYLAVALPSGSGKSPVFGRLVGPVQTIEDERVAGAIRDRAEAEAKRKAKENLLKKAEHAGNEAEMLRLAVEIAEMEVPPGGPGIADDATPEALAGMMADTGGVLSIMSSEGQVFDQMCGQYVDHGSKANIDIYKKGFSGERLRQARVKRGLVNIEAAILTIAVATQPSVIDRLKAAPELASEGVTARFLYSLPATNIGRRDRSKVRASMDVSAWETNAEAIGRRFAATKRPVTIGFTEDATDAFIAWDQGIEDQLLPGGALAPMTEWCMKLRTSMVRLCGILAVCDGEAEVTVSVVERAIRMADYWIAHARTVHGMWGVGDGDETLARMIARWLVGQVTEKGAEKVSVRKIGHAFWAQCKDRGGYWEALPGPLSILIECGWLTPEDPEWEQRKGSGKRSPEFRIGEISLAMLAERDSDGKVIERAEHSIVTETGTERNKSVASVASVARGGLLESSSFLIPPTNPDPATHATDEDDTDDCHDHVGDLDALETAGTALFGGGPCDDDTAIEEDRYP